MSTPRRLYSSHSLQLLGPRNKGEKEEAEEERKEKREKKIPVKVARTYLAIFGSKQS